jgi:ketosteroid isomerase-like protein
VSQDNVDLLKSFLPGSETDLVGLFRDEGVFASIRGALADRVHADVECVPAWRGAGAVYSGFDGFREMWLDWLEPWASYRTQLDEIIDAGDRVVVLVRDRARRHDTDVEVELISGSVWTFRDRKIARVEFYANREELADATGLGGA